MSRRTPRYRASLAITGSPEEGGDVVACRSRDISVHGISLDTSARWFPGMRIALATFDHARGEALELAGEVVRAVTGPRPIVGVRLDEPPAAWSELVASHAATLAAAQPSLRRQRVLVIGDIERQRGAMALYVNSGWDVIFAVDQDSLVDAVESVTLDAVVAEADERDEWWLPMLGEVRRLQPRARRIVRTGGIASGADPHGVAHRLVEREAGLDALVDALTATY